MALAQEGASPIAKISLSGEPSICEPTLQDPQEETLVMKDHIKKHRQTARDAPLSSPQISRERKLKAKAVTPPERDSATSIPSRSDLPTRPAAVAKETEGFDSSSEMSDRLSKSMPAQISAKSSVASLVRSQRSSGVSYATVKDPHPKDRGTLGSPVTPRAPSRLPRNEPQTPLLHCDFGSVVGDNTYSVVSDQVFDLDSYSLFASLVKPLPTIPRQVAHDQAEANTTAPVSPRKFLRGRVEPVWREPIVELKPATPGVTSIVAAVEVESSSEESLPLSHESHLDRKSVPLTIFPNASDTTFATSSGSSSSHARPLSPTGKSAVTQGEDDIEYDSKDSDEDDRSEEGQVPNEDPPSYESVVPTRRRAQSDAGDSKPRLLLNNSLRDSYRQKMIERHEICEAMRQSAPNDAEESRERKPGILGSFKRWNPFGSKKAKTGSELRSGPSIVHWRPGQPQ